jgi:hypothetical protein
MRVFRVRWKGGDLQRSEPRRLPLRCSVLQYSWWKLAIKMFVIKPHKHGSRMKSSVDVSVLMTG